MDERVSGMGEPDQGAGSEDRAVARSGERAAASTRARWWVPVSRSLEDILWEVVPRDHRQDDTAFRRRRLVALATLVIGAAVLAVSLRVPPGDDAFYPATLALAAVWVVGGFASGPLHLGRIHRGGRFVRPVVEPIAVGLALSVAFVGAALIAREVPFLSGQAEYVLEHATKGSGWAIWGITVVNAVAEEIFFRGGLYAAVRAPHQVLVTTVAYTVAVVATGNLMLAAAAVVLGVTVGLQRRASGGVLAPSLTHVTWGTAMYLVLPHIFPVA